MIFFVTWQAEMFPRDVRTLDSGQMVQPFSPKVSCLPDTFAVKYFLIKMNQFLMILCDDICMYTCFCVSWGA